MSKIYPEINQDEKLDLIEKFSRNGQLEKAITLTSQADASVSPKTENPKRSYHLDELASIPPVDWLIGDHISTGGLSMLYGDSGVGKSFLALSWSLSVATGEPYLDKHQVKQGAVVYIAGEGVSGLHKRVEAWLDYHKKTCPKNFIVIPQPYDLMSIDGVNAVIDIIKKDLGCNPALVVVDTVFRNMNGNICSPQDAQIFVSGCDIIKRAFNTAVLVLHHTGKDATKKEVGTQNIRQSSENVFQLKPNGNGCLVCCEKQKDFADTKEYPLVKIAHLNSLIFAENSPMMAKQAALPETIRKLLGDIKHHKQNVQFTVKELMTVLDENAKEDTVRNWLKRLTEDGLLMHDKPNYSLSEPFKLEWYLSMPNKGV